MPTSPVLTGQDGVVGVAVVGDRGKRLVHCFTRRFCGNAHLTDDLRCLASRRDGSSPSFG